MKKAVVSGYATLDYVIQMYDQFHGTGTALGAMGPSGAWPRAGGAVLYVSRRLAAAGTECHAMTWIGADSDGEHFLNACVEANIKSNAICISPTRKTPRCMMIYNPDGGYGCLLDAGSDCEEHLTEKQEGILGQADLVCISVGPLAATSSIVERCPDDAIVAWIVKIDHDAFSPELRRKIATRADYIFCNADERQFVADCLPQKKRTGQTIIETLGSAGVLVESDQQKTVLSADFVKTSDTTGAGDTLAGEVLASVVEGDYSVIDAVQRGMNAARELLAARPLPDKTL